MRRGIRALLLSLAGTFLLSGPLYAKTLRVAVAANFKPVMGEIVSRFESATGNRVVLSYASTGTLYNQLVHGAPFDVFLSADQKRPGLLVKKGLVDGKAETYAYGRLVLWRRGGPAPTLDDLRKPGLKLAIANPATAPYGTAAKESLEVLGLWKTVSKNVVKGASIQQAWQFVATGNVPMGFVALSQLRKDKVKDEFCVVREDMYSPLRQDAVVLAKSRQLKLAHRFVEFLRMPEQQACIQDAGYYPVIDPAIGGRKEEGKEG
ncbi:molybdate ABC transporter substrate-binding protein [Sansalvadorimonas sp. 2012CJ34-2]|uniref:Molybdate ABC transporter substrate-binding protein n=1 Tax=Parendozoicomonas callyspongiae TaxID=2942213 RepID=A0ABT0PJ67_9GAMM|nr:molybdate ABC transporter substrate-binding protein [Sansalvadorimonas sp. 2012CJ34-2]MCL6271373.1 molybdate ABC transporter substrate-binding protein [Sansalvadorimonas sp. 2012CJ34-2]